MMRSIMLSSDELMACRRSVGRVSGKVCFQAVTRAFCRLYTIFWRISEIVGNFKLRHDRANCSVDHLQDIRYQKANTMSSLEVIDALLR